LSSRSSATKDVGVWAVEGTGLRVLRNRPRKVSVDAEGLTLDRIEAVTVVVKGKAHDVVTDASSVGELLSAMRIEPDGNDRIDPPPSTPLSRVNRITYRSVSTRLLATIRALVSPPSTTATGALPAGSTETLGRGRPAEILRRWRMRIVDGKPVSRKLVFSRVLRPAVLGRRVVGSGATPATSTESSASSSTSSSTVGEASWYYINDGLAAASPWLPFGTHVTVTNLSTGASVTVVINDRGPFGGRLIDLSEYAFSHIAPLGQGVCLVRISW
jgi:hypothetical protein